MNDIFGLNSKKICVKLNSDTRVNKDSLKRKIQKFKNVDTEQKKDLFAELECAADMLEIASVKELILGDTPDIKITIGNNIVLGVEVKRIRRRTEDDRDEKAADNSEGVVRVGYRDKKQEPWIKVVCDDIGKKAGNQYSTVNTLLFLKSDSPYQIEWGEIEDGIKDAYITRTCGIPFCAIVYKTAWVDNFPLTAVFIHHTEIEKQLITDMRVSHLFKLKQLIADVRILDL
ncbi:MAG: hypothetical protein WC602_01585 [archaeon]